MVQFYALYFSTRSSAETSSCSVEMHSLRPRPRGGHFGIARSVRLSVPRRSCLGYRHAGWLQLSHRRPPGMCGLRTRPRTDVDPPRFLDRTAIDGGAGAYRLAAPGAIPCSHCLFCTQRNRRAVRNRTTCPARDDCFFVLGRGNASVPFVITVIATAL